jgi:hypothetical protein
MQFECFDPRAAWAIITERPSRLEQGPMHPSLPKNWPSLISEKIRNGHCNFFFHFAHSWSWSTDALSFHLRVATGRRTRFMSSTVAVVGYDHRQRALDLLSPVGGCTIVPCRRAETSLAAVPRVHGRAGGLQRELTISTVAQLLLHILPLKDAAFCNT